MGSIQDFNETLNPGRHEVKIEHRVMEKIPTSRVNNEGFRSSKITGLATDLKLNPTGMKDEIVLLSWFIVLLRTHEEGTFSYEWAYKSYSNRSESKRANGCISIDQVIPDLQTTVEQASASIARYITTNVLDQNTLIGSPASLTLSTSSLSRTFEKANDGMSISHPHASVKESILPTTHDLNDIWRWNYQLPRSYNFCMHEVISQRAHEHPEKVAIDSWDGSLTYGQVDRYSTFIASSLKELDVELHDFLPVCFEKSKWTIVAVLAAMKAGATFVLMDPTLPTARLQNMANQVGARNMLASRKQHDLATSIVPDGNIIVIEADTFTDISNQHAMSKLTPVPSSTLMYIIFTSGSTGTPKGVKISHETYTSSAFPRAKAVGYTEESRVLDFASYAFDVSIDSMILTLANGGCLCIPSDEGRMNDINGIIRKMRVNYAGITPSVARVLEPEVITSLSGLGLGGEAASARDVTTWGRDTRIIIGYGPCECTIGCTVNSSAATGRDYISIGTGNGAAIWIVNPNDHETLMPVGAVGELLVEGPIVGQGYLNDSEKTAAAFIEDPHWLLSGHGEYPGRRGRLYKTGDLGKYDPDGSGGIVFAGRKDTQVKLRGQRVELGEIESQLKATLPVESKVIAEVIVPQGTGNQATLVAFITFQSTKGPDSSTNLQLEHLSHEMRSKLSKADAELTKVLPRYMVPTVYIPVNYIPVLISGKTDRRQLRQFGATVDLRQLDQGTESIAIRELTDLEQRLRQAWSETLKLDAESIRPEDNFFVLGGDSLAAMRLVSFCREQMLDVSVANTFDHPTLSAMASVVRIRDSQNRTETYPFSMISQTAEACCSEACQVYGFEREVVEDIYPCTPTQESLFTFSLKSIKPYVAQRVATIESSTSLYSWKRAWEEVVAASPILRTRLAQLQEPGLQQVVLKEGISWKFSNNLVQYLDDDRKEKMNLGQSLARYAIVDDSSDGKRYMVWTVHHVLYDGWSEPILLKQVSNILYHQNIDTKAQMRDFVKYVRDTDEVSMQEYWQRELKDAVGPQFPRLPSRDYLPNPDAEIEHHISIETVTGFPFTMATLIRGAWALVASQHTGSDDVVFGETLTGRDIALPGVESIIGPLIATVPVRIHVHRTASTESYLQLIQHGMLARIPYQHMGMQNIRKVSHDAQHACEAATGLVIQPEPEYVGSELGFGNGDVVREALHFNPYPLMLACGIRKGGFRVCASFDSSLIDVAQMKRVLVQLEIACSQLTNGLSRKVGEISCLPQVELDQIWRWNQNPPCSFDESSRILRTDASIKQGSIYPQVAVPWVCDPRNPSLLSPIGCIGELWLEGNFLSGDVVQSPAWLVAGSSVYVGRTGKVQATGDMVQLREDGSLIFVGRKEDVIPIQGHAVNIPDLEAHLTRQLPSTIRTAAAVFQTSISGASPVVEKELVVFVEHTPSEEDSVELTWMQHRISCDASVAQGFEMTTCAMIPTNLAATVKRLNKFLKDSLPSYMVPSAYVVVDKIPTVAAYVDHSLLNQLASKIPTHVLDQIREGFKKAWTENTAQKKLTLCERILQSSWANVLKIDPEKIDVDDNFFRLGGDSVLAMKLVSNLRAQGHTLTVADIFQHMRLGDAATRLKVGDTASKKEAQPYKAFSILGHLDVESFLSEIIRPNLADPYCSIQDVAPVTDSQAVDIKNTIQVPRTSIQYTMLYFDKGIDREQLLRAFNELVKAHDILRTVFVQNESSYFQVVLNEMDSPLRAYRTDGDLEKYVNQLCMQDIELKFQLGSSFLKTLHVEDKDGQQCLAIGLSHAQYDGISLPRLLRDLETMYTGGMIVNFESFASYVAQIRNENTQIEATKYWRNLLNGSSLSVLDGKSDQPAEKSIFHTRAVEDVPLPLEDITIASLLSAAWALVLARRLRTADVTFGSVTSGRNMDLKNIENVVGPCYQLTPVRVAFDPEWTAMDFLRSVQRQSAESAGYDFLGFSKISKDCAQWFSLQEGQFFDSIVHHQDFDDFDTMPFAGGTCRVEILNPHGDAADPLKVVSFVRGGQMYVGIVGYERDTEFVDSVLAELDATVRELIMHRSEKVFLDGRIF
ncbi:Nonribosomal peptide synthetase 4 [Talaromyces atroroseus]|uniref:Nonribosomal peptide synthetase 4 n=1 Tax=Talaromyces atroroseus TaxID=1441469 RepID=A0A1Q5QC88_TALAT|nr:Nonribosomal peptide synthetase 4 [Talaromyces atroroseus]OKL63567.1 Nonribosomal peptide synthetase 4 [Talaromyces atroroseus]